jgi:fluoroacetyl-CoA thioesterase
MDLTQIIKPGMKKEFTFRVEEEHSAVHVGSGSLQVLATPWMITFMERTARQLLGELLPEGYSSVGVRLEVSHLAPTPVGSMVKTSAQVTAIEDTKVYFDISAWDEVEKIGDGQHQRVVIDEERFLRRVAKKG